jgi:hypothetical protein
MNVTSPACPSLKDALQDLKNLAWDIPTLSISESDETDISASTTSPVGAARSQDASSLQHSNSLVLPASSSWESLKADLETRDQRTFYDQEVETAFRRQLRTTALRNNFERFRELSRRCFRFVAALTHEGRQSLLGVRAGLMPAEPAARASLHVEFKPLSIPVIEDLPGSSYETLLGTPTEVGARLLWWCAAATDPQSFGYRADHVSKLWDLPIWFDIQKNSHLPSKFTTVFESIPSLYQVHATLRPIRLLQESAQFVATTEVSNPNYTPSDVESGSSLYGVHGDDIFWEGRPIPFSNQERIRDLARLVLERYPHSVHKKTAIEVVWKGNNRKVKTITSCCYRLSTHFNHHRVPLKITFNQSTSLIETLYLNQGPNPLDSCIP